MPRTARLVVPKIAHHVIQRGNRQQPIFFSDRDRVDYIQLLAAACKEAGTHCLAWCLMDNHIHLILVPKDRDGLRAPLARVHTAYSQRINSRQGVTGHLFQGRYLSYPMDDAHMMVAVRYVENNPVAAGIVELAEEWRWSSARAHIFGTDDGLTDTAMVGQHVPNWRAMLRSGIEAGGETMLVNEAIRSGLLLGQSGKKRGRPPKRGLSPL